MFNLGMIRYCYLRAGWFFMKGGKFFLEDGSIFLMDGNILLPTFSIQFIIQVCNVCQEASCGIYF